MGDLLFSDLVGRRFAWGGDDPVLGFDCWGAVRIVARRLGLADPGPHPATQSHLDCAQAVRGTVDALRIERLDASAHDELGDVWEWAAPGGETHVAPVVGLNPTRVLHARSGDWSTVARASFAIRPAFRHRLPRDRGTAPAPT